MLEYVRIIWNSYVDLCFITLFYRGCVGVLGRDVDSYLILVLSEC
jgi:hypothetical protein